MNIRCHTRMRWLAPLAALPLLGLPLRAAEPPRPAEAEAPAAPEQPAPQQAEDTQPASSGNQAPPKAAAPADEEEVSLDSNLSFPVDI
jgi:hypothetical protein